MTTYFTHSDIPENLLKELNDRILNEIAQGYRIGIEEIASVFERLTRLNLPDEVMDQIFDLMNSLQKSDQDDDNDSGLAFVDFRAVVKELFHGLKDSDATETGDDEENILEEDDPEEYEEDDEEGVGTSDDTEEEEEEGATDDSTDAEGPDIRDDESTPFVQRKVVGGGDWKPLYSDSGNGIPKNVSNELPRNVSPTTVMPGTTSDMLRKNRATGVVTSVNPFETPPSKPEEHATKDLSDVPWVTPRLPGFTPRQKEINENDKLIEMMLHDIVDPCDRELMQNAIRSSGLMDAVRKIQSAKESLNLPLQVYDRAFRRCMAMRPDDEVLRVIYFEVRKAVEQAQEVVNDNARLRSRVATLDAEIAKLRMQLK